MTGSPCNIVTASEVEAEWVAVQLRSFNRQHVPSLNFESIWLVAKDTGGNVIGGFVGEVYLRWLEVKILWVSELSRGSGLGRRLLQEGEALALKMGANTAFLDTFSWQGGGFYLRNGYVTFAQLDDFPPGAARMFLKKSLRQEQRAALCTPSDDA